MEKADLIRKKIAEVLVSGKVQFDGFIPSIPEREGRRYYRYSAEAASRLLTPCVLRNALYLAIAAAAVQPLHRVWSQFWELTGEARVENNAQVCWMEKIINDRFDYYERRITVGTLRPNSHASFYVEIPNGFVLSPAERAELSDMIDRNRLAGMKYFIRVKS